MNTENVFRFRSGETTVELRTAHDELQHALTHIYRSFLDGDEVGSSQLPAVSGDAAVWQAEVDGKRFAFDELEEAIFELENEIADRLLKDYTDCLLLHAAAVSDDEGSVLLVGPSGHGKTTMALELVRRGMLYVTDEYTAIEACGTVLRPFPRSAVQKFDSRAKVGENLEVPSDWGYCSHLLPDRRAKLNARPLRTCRIIFPQHNADQTPAVRPLGAAESCARLMPSIFHFEGKEKETWPMMANVVSSARACELTYRDAKTDVDLALDMLG